jgi:predicted Zn-dependent peptidase
MFQGSASYDREYFDAFEPIGAAVNGTTNQERTNYYERVPRNYLERAFWMESDRMFHLLPVLTQQKLDNQRDVVKNERRQSYENRPYGMVGVYLPQLLYPAGHPYHEPVIGSHVDLTAATLQDVKRFFREYYAPANAVLTVVGDFDASRTQSLAQQYFGRGPGGKRATLPSPALRRIERRLHFTYPDRVELPRIHLAWPQAPDYFPALVYNRLLGGAFGSRLNLNLREDKGYTYGARSEFVRWQEVGYWGLTARVQAQVTDASTREMLREIADSCGKRPVTGAEREEAVQGLLLGLPGRFESLAETALQISELPLYDRPLDWYLRWPARVQRVSVAETNAVARAYCDPSEFVIVIAGDARRVRPGLTALGLRVVPYDARLRVLLPEPNR